jgi:dipeptidyl peptidase-like protein
MIGSGLWRRPSTILCFALFACLTAIPGLAQTSTKALIRVPVANMFSGSSADTDVVSQAIYASDVTVLEQKDGFSHVRTPDSYTGWIRNNDLLPHSDASSGPFAQVRSLTANLYREPDVTKHAPLLTVPFETHLEILSQSPPENEDYLRVRLLDQREAWIDRGDVELNPFQNPSNWPNAFSASPTRGAEDPASASTAQASHKCSSADGVLSCHEMLISRQRGRA